MQVRTAFGPDALDRAGEAFDDLAEAAGVPITARRPWLSTWLGCFRSWEGVLLSIEGEGGRLEAAATLALRGRRLRQVVAAGHRAADYIHFPARSQEAAEALAAAIVDWVRGLGGPWALRLEQLPVGDPVAHGVAAGIPGARLLPGDAAPHALLDRGPDVASYLTRNLRQTERTSWNRALREDMAGAVVIADGPEALEGALPEMERLRRARDAALGRPTDLGDPEMGPFWRAIMRELSARGELRVVLIELGGRPAAYSTCLVDGGAYRMWDTRFDPDLGAFSPGRLADLTSLRRALADPTLVEYDWMRGVEPYKLQSATDVREAETLVAWSGPVVRFLREAPAAGRGALRAVKDRSPALGRAWRAVKRAAMRTRRSR